MSDFVVILLAFFVACFSCYVLARILKKMEDK